MLQQNILERFHLRMKSVCRAAMRISAKTFYTCELETALYFFLRELKNMQIYFLTNLQYI